MTLEQISNRLEAICTNLENEEFTITAACIALRNLKMDIDNA